MDTEIVNTLSEIIIDYMRKRDECELLKSENRILMKEHEKVMRTNDILKSIVNIQQDNARVPYLNPKTIQHNNEINNLIQNYESIMWNIIEIQKIDARLKSYNEKIYDENHIMFSILNQLSHFKEFIDINNPSLNDQYDMAKKLKSIPIEITNGMRQNIQTQLKNIKEIHQTINETKFKFTPVFLQQFRDMHGNTIKTRDLMRQAIMIATRQLQTESSEDGDLIGHVAELESEFRDTPKFVFERQFAALPQFQFIPMIKISYVNELPSNKWYYHNEININLLNSLEKNTIWHIYYTNKRTNNEYKGEKIPHNAFGIISNKYTEKMGDNQGIWFSTMENGIQVSRFVIDKDTITNISGNIKCYKKHYDYQNQCQGTTLEPGYEIATNDFVEWYNKNYKYILEESNKFTSTELMDNDMINKALSLIIPNNHINDVIDKMIDYFEEDKDICNILIKIKNNISYNVSNPAVIRDLTILMNELFTKLKLNKVLMQLDRKIIYKKSLDHLFKFFNNKYTSLASSNENTLNNSKDINKIINILVFENVTEHYEEKSELKRKNELMEKFMQKLGKIIIKIIDIISRNIFDLWDMDNSQKYWEIEEELNKMRELIRINPIVYNKQINDGIMKLCTIMNIEKIYCEKESYVDENDSVIFYIKFLNMIKEFIKTKPNIIVKERPRQKKITEITDEEIQNLSAMPGSMTEKILTKYKAGRKIKEMSQKLKESGKLSDVIQKIEEESRAKARELPKIPPPVHKTDSPFELLPPVYKPQLPSDIEELYSQNGGYLNDPNYFKYIKYKTKYLNASGKNKDVIRKMLLRK